MAKVAILMSGGVDSAFAALRLKTQGHEVEGVTAWLWGADSSSASEGIAAARETCRALGIPHTVLDLRRDFQERVLDPFVSTYIDGMTPNPCALCNRDIKLGKLAALAGERGFDSVATGHYARLCEVAGRITFREPLDLRKSQVYFLSLVDPGVLESLMLPLGDCLKQDVIRLVDEAGLPARARESQDLCFAAGGRYQDVLSHGGYSLSPGPVLDAGGEVVGTHKGHAAYTVGQRFGMKGKRFFVLEKRPGVNAIVIGERSDALKTRITASRINLFLPLSVADSTPLSIRYRYNSSPVGATLADACGGGIEVKTDVPCFAPAPGQILAGYKGDKLVFGGIIESAV